MIYLPLNHNFRDRQCLIVGGGRIARRRAERILAAGGKVLLVAPQIDEALASQVLETGGQALRRHYEPGDMSGDHALAIAATDDHELNRRIAADARVHGIPVNVVSDSSLCDVVFPMTIDRDPITISIASGTSSPTLTRLLGNRINALVPSGYGRLAQLVGGFRKQAQQLIPDTRKRIRFWENILQGVVAESVFSGNMEEARARLESALESPDSVNEKGEVYLIGAGPGDPDLLTLRAFRLLQQADVVLYDRLVSPQIMENLGPHTEKIYVGKERARHAVPQQDINQMLIDHALQGKRVARLKGGDPFIFGRGGEEIERLAGQRIPFQVIPGISAANGCASYAGIPLTHRDHAQSVRFITGQLKDGTVDLKWETLAAPGQTLVFYMSLQGLPIICERLQQNGMPASMPAALVEKGTTLEQKVYISTVGDLPGVLDSNDIDAPTILIIGTVVTLHDKLKWF